MPEGDKGEGETGAPLVIVGEPFPAPILLPEGGRSGEGYANRGEDGRNYSSGEGVSGRRRGRSHEKPGRFFSYYLISPDLLPFRFFSTHCRLHHCCFPGTLKWYSGFSSMVSLSSGSAVSLWIRSGYRSPEFREYPGLSTQASLHAGPEQHPLKWSRQRSRQSPMTAPAGQGRYNFKPFRKGAAFHTRFADLHDLPVTNLCMAFPFRFKHMTITRISHHNRPITGNRGGYYFVYFPHPLPFRLFLRSVSINSCRSSSWIRTRSPILNALTFPWRIHSLMVRGLIRRIPAACSMV
jgi:hypothetical protein